jgi:hypothetical protein
VAVPNAETTQIIMLVERMSALEQRRIDSQQIIDQHKETIPMLAHNKQLAQQNLREQI